MTNIKLRDYQKECINKINNLNSGSYLIRMATGLGKTVIFTHIKRKGRVLILAHREELINQPKQFYDCPVGIEKAQETSNGEPVVIASVMSLVRRLQKFDKNAFDTIIVDEAHHAAAPSYMKILDYFNPRLTLGFTATPKRGDNVGLGHIFSDIIYDKDIIWGIKNNFLSNVDCLRVDIGYNVSRTKITAGDYNKNELEKAVNIELANKAIGDVYKKYAKGQTLIFAASVNHARNIQKQIKGSWVVTAQTVDRAKILEMFRRKKIRCIINVDVFTKGTDVPNIETIIMARPTQSSTAYIQRVGRGLRLALGKKKLLLIDCVGDSGKHKLCTAPSLIGLSTDFVPKNKLKNIEGNLFELEDIISYESDVPESWIRNTEFVNIWAQDNNYNTHNINFYQMPDGSLNCRIPKEESSGKYNEQDIITIPFPDELGYTYLQGKKLTMQQAIDKVYQFLKTHKKYCEPIWNLELVKKWGEDSATRKQIYIINKKLPDFKVSKLTKHQASEILNRLASGYSHDKDKIVNELKVFNDKVFPSEYIVLFISTTGNEEDGDIYRITAFKYKDFRRVDIFDSFVFSPLEETRKYYRQYNLEHFRKLPQLEAVCYKFKEFVGDCPVFAHKMPYALDFLSKKGIDFNDINCYDTEQITKERYPSFSSYGLDTLRSLLLLKFVNTRNVVFDRINLNNELIKSLFANNK